MKKWHASEERDTRPLRLKLNSLSLQEPGHEAIGLCRTCHSEVVPIVSKLHGNYISRQHANAAFSPKILKPFGLATKPHHLLTKPKPKISSQRSPSTLPQQFDFFFSEPMPGPPKAKCAGAFLDLPPEVRNEIYKHVFAGQVISVRNPTVTIPRNGYNGKILSLFFVNRLIHSETVAVALSNVLIHIPNQLSAKVLVDSLSRANTNRIKKLLIPSDNSDHLITTIDWNNDSMVGIFERYVDAGGVKAFQPEILLLYKSFRRLKLPSEMRKGINGLGVVAEIASSEMNGKRQGNAVWKLRRYGVFALVKKGPEEEAKRKEIAMRGKKRTRK